MENYPIIPHKISSPQPGRLHFVWVVLDRGFERLPRLGTETPREEVMDESRQEGNIPNHFIVLYWLLLL